MEGEISVHYEDAMDFSNKDGLVHYIFGVTGRKFQIILCISVAEDCFALSKK